MSQHTLADLVDRAQREVDEGRLPSCQFAFARGGEVVYETTIGDATADSRYVVFSSTKAIVAAAVWILLGEGTLEVDARVCEYVPEFAANGKDAITVEQVLLHTSGFPHAPFDPLTWSDLTQRLARFATWRCNWEPGTRFEYHPTSAHWVLAELIERVTGTDFRVFVRARVLDPLGLSRLEVGVARADQHDITTLVRTGSPATADEIRAAIGVDSLPVTEVTPEALVRFNRPEVREVGVPGAGAVARASDIARFYQALLDDRLGLWKPEVLTDVTSVVRNRFPDYVGTPANRTRGLVVAGDDGAGARRGMGHTVSPRAFGHNGAGGQIAWADPATGVSFCFLTNGLDQHQLREWRRTAGIASRAGIVSDLS
ncbi:MAG: serine hydrolase domain-containing protein [Actinomycetota bacterium]